MKTFAVGLIKRNDQYRADCGSFALLQLDGRESIQKHMESIKECMKKKGYTSFVIIRLPSLLSNWNNWIIWKEIEENLKIDLD